MRGGLAARVHAAPCSSLPVAGCAITDGDQRREYRQVDTHRRVSLEAERAEHLIMAHTAVVRAVHGLHLFDQP